MTRAEGQAGANGVNARVATDADVAAVAETMAGAFYNDPVWGWVFPDPDRRRAQHEIFWRLFIEGALGYHWVWLTDQCASASLWIPPGGSELPEEEAKLEPLLDELLGELGPRAMKAMERFGASRPDEPHYYLSLLATHPDHRGKGLGMGLLADNLARIDAEHEPAYLESTNPNNDSRYERLGFVRSGEFSLPERGPLVATMWRDAR